MSSLPTCIRYSYVHEDLYFNSCLIHTCQPVCFKKSPQLNLVNTVSFSCVGSLTAVTLSGGVIVGLIVQTSASRTFMDIKGLSYMLLYFICVHTNLYVHPSAVGPLFALPFYTVYQGEKGFLELIDLCGASALPELKVK